MSHNHWKQRQTELRDCISAGKLAYVFLNPDGTLQSLLGVVLERPTGVVYGHQCAGLNCAERLVEGAFVPLGGARYDGQAAVAIDTLQSCFHRGGNCHSGDGQAIPAELLEQLAEQVAQIAYWSHGSSETGTTRNPLQLDRNRHAEIVEGWIPVHTSHGPAILIFENCD